MGAQTRIKRPTYSTPRRDQRPLRFVHVSTSYMWLPVNPKDPLGPVQFTKVVKGVTYRAAEVSA